MNFIFFSKNHKVIIIMYGGGGQYVLVDLDNISFYDSVPNTVCIASRLRNLLTAYPRHQFGFFCNVKTQALLKTLDKSIFPVDTILRYVYVTSTHKDSADHALLDALLDKILIPSRGSIQNHVKEVVIATSDKTLARLVTYFWQSFTNVDSQQWEKRLKKTAMMTSAVLSFCMFKNASPDPCYVLRKYSKNRFPLHFNDREDLNAFIVSLTQFLTKHPRHHKDAGLEVSPSLTLRR
jgi:hypothetical protein